MKRGVVAMLIACPLVIVPSWGGASGRQSTPEIMREKMGLAQELLEDLAIGNFEAVEEKANRLHYLSELQSWFVLPTQEYDDHSKEFRRAAEQAAAAGSSQDLDAASDAYGSMIKKCVQCHAYMRRVRETSKEGF